MKELYSNSLQKKVIQIALRTQKNFFYRVIQRTVLTIFPFVLIGSFAKTIQLIFLSKNGLFSNLLDFIPDSIYFQIEGVVTVISNLTIGWISVIAAYLAAKYSAKYFKRDDQLAGLTASISLLIIAYTYSKKTSFAFHQSILGIRGLLFAILMGIFVGYLFKMTSKKASPINFSSMSSSALNRAFTSMTAIFLMIVIAAIFSAAVNVTFYSNLPETVISQISSTNPSTIPWLRLLRTLGLGTYTVIMSFLGWSGPYSSIGTSYSDTTSIANLNYALNHHTTWGAPDIFNSNALYHTFAAYGGTGATLALIIAVFWISKDRDFLTVSRWSLIPSIFNINSPLLSGIPVFFNVIFFIPFIAAPLVNMLLAALVLQLHLMPPAVYSVPVGTSGPLIAFLGTNGSWQVLLFTLFSLFISVLIYIPFVRIAEKVKTIDNLAADERGEDHEI